MVAKEQRLGFDFAGVEDVEARFVVFALRWSLEPSELQMESRDQGRTTACQLQVAEPVRRRYDPVH